MVEWEAEMTDIPDDYYGWFWCGGVAPVGVRGSGITATTTLVTNALVAIGAVTTVDASDTDDCGLGLAVTLKNDCGFSMKADD